VLKPLKKKFISVLLKYSART